MKEDEIKFFIVCVSYISAIVNGEVITRMNPRELINILDLWLPHKRAWYYLEKWDRLGFYDYGVSLDMGWLIMDKIPQRYKDLLK